MRHFALLFFIILTFQTIFAQDKNHQSEIEFAESQIDFMIKQIEISDESKNELPRSLDNERLKTVASSDWTSGFFPGILWYLYEATGDKKWLTQAESFTSILEKEQYNKGTHDLGFMIYCSYGNAYRLTKNEKYKQIIINAAKSLSTRFNAKIGAIKSWDHNKNLWTYPVIIDNMMNLELLFEATKLTGDSSFYKIAVAHANTTLKNHFRPDFSSYHVIDYDPESGKVIKKVTHQGYANESAWARGQAWALYGFTLVYRETKDEVYLNQANQIAKYILNHPKLPKDKVPFWDFNDPDIPNTSKDASAAAIVASALYELSSYNFTTIYKKNANKILKSLTNNYQSDNKGNVGFILMHSTGHKPYKSEIDVPLIYADYYYLEALLRRKEGFQN